MNSTPLEKFSDFLTVSGALKRAKAENLPVTEYALRRWIRTGALPARKINRKAIIYWPRLLDFLSCADEVGNDRSDDDSSGFGLIRRQN